MKIWASRPFTDRIGSPESVCRGGGLSERSGGQYSMTGNQEIRIMNLRSYIYGQTNRYWKA